jgi:hypothetical protein
MEQRPSPIVVSLTVIAEDAATQAGRLDFSRSLR